MREIKFKGKSLSGEWCYGNLAVTQQKIHNVDAGVYISNALGAPYKVRPETVCEYIGYSDIRGIDIYEGDILKDA